MVNRDGFENRNKKSWQSIILPFLAVQDRKVDLKCSDPC